MDKTTCSKQNAVFINGSLSKHCALAAGIPQGSILGPFLFLVYVKAIADGLTCVTRLSADDTSLTASSNDITTIDCNLNEHLQKLQKWSKQWLVTFNPDKFHVVLLFFKFRISINPLLTTKLYFVYPPPPPPPPI